MITITPQGIVYLCKTPLESDYKNQLTFTNKEAQEEYFNSKITFAFNNEQYTYIKKDSTITIGKPIDEINNCNYLFYRNVGFTNKIYYCFIKSMEYVNENSTRIYFETDVFQTYQFDIEYNTTFVEREHVNDDTIGLHTIPEGLETGEYVVQVGTETPYQLTGLHYLINTYICIAITELPGEATPGVYTNDGRLYDGIYSGLFYLIFQNGVYADKFIRGANSLTTGDIIHSIFMVPKDICDVSSSDFTEHTIGGIETVFAWNRWSSTPQVLGEIGINKETYLDEDYVPRNMKLLTYPYRYFTISNNAGSSNVYQYEMFTETQQTITCNFVIKGTISPGCNIRLIPENCKQGNLINALDGAKLPTCSWTTDPYINWLTQNSVNLKLNTIKSIGAIVGGTAVTLATGGTGAFIGAGLIATGVGGIFDSVKSNYEHSLTPETANGGANQGDLNFSDKNTFSLYKMSIKKEMAQVIDRYFDMFGYKVNMIKTPNITGRVYYNYVKTIDCNFDGDIPQEYMKQIRAMFDSGITLWHDPTKMYDYSVNNAIVS